MNLKYVDEAAKFLEHLVTAQEGISNAYDCVCTFKSPESAELREILEKLESFVNHLEPTVNFKNRTPSVGQPALTAATGGDINN